MINLSFRYKSFKDYPATLSPIPGGCTPLCLLPFSPFLLCPVQDTNDVLGKPRYERELVARKFSDFVFRPDFPYFFELLFRNVLSCPRVWCVDFDIPTSDADNFHCVAEVPSQDGPIFDDGTWFQIALEPDPNTVECWYGLLSSLI